MNRSFYPECPHGKAEGCCTECEILEIREFADGFVPKLVEKVKNGEDVKEFFIEGLKEFEAIETLNT